MTYIGTAYIRPDNNRSEVLAVVNYHTPKSLGYVIIELGNLVEEASEEFRQTQKLYIEIEVQPAS